MFIKANVSSLVFQHKVFFFFFFYDMHYNNIHNDLYEVLGVDHMNPVVAE